MRKILSIGVSLACLYIAFQQVNLQQVFSALSNTNLSYIIAALIITNVTFILRSLRWRTLLNAPRSLTLNHYSSTTHIGYFLNNILPFRAGDIFRAKLLSNHDRDIKLSYLIGSLVGENNTIVQQIDIMPTILEEVAYTKPYLAFGKSLFSNESWAISKLYSNYRFITDQGIINNKEESYPTFRA